MDTLKESIPEHGILKRLKRLSDYIPKQELVEKLEQEIKMICHCLLIESSDGLILIDSGIGLQDIKYPKARLGKKFIYLFGRPILKESETAIAQIRRIGLNPKDVRHIIISHLDVDHAGGISDFPHAKVHLLNWEYEAAMFPQNLKQKLRYRKQQWKHFPLWSDYKVGEGEKWNGFQAVRNLDGIKDDIFLIPLGGHSKGHTGVVVNGSKETLFFCGDAYLHPDQVNPSCSCTPGPIEFYNKLVHEDYNKFERNLNKIKELKDGCSENLKIFCSHSKTEYDSFNKVSII